MRILSNSSKFSAGWPLLPAYNFLATMATTYSTYYLGAVASLKFLAVENMPPPLFGPCLLWSNGWMEQDTTWYGVRPRPRRQCARLGPTSPTGTGTAAPHFSAHAYCGQTAGWIVIPLQIVLLRYPKPTPKPRFFAKTVRRRNLGFFRHN